MKKITLFSLLASLIFIACENTNTTSTENNTFSEEEITEETLQFNTAMDSLYDAGTAMSPISQAYLGIKDRYDEWDINNDSMSLVYHEMEVEQVAFIKDNFNFDKLDAQGKITYRLFVNDTEESIANFDWRFHNYPINQMFGTHSWIPSFMMSIHTISDKSDAEAWLTRFSKIDVKIDELIVNLETRKEMGIIAPKFVYPHIIRDCKNLIAGEGEEHVMIADFKMDLDALEDVSAEEKDAMIAEASALLEENFKPAYNKLIDYVTELETMATDEAGVWKLPNGDDYYQVALKRTTTTEYTPQEIFDIGMSEVERIHGEMEKIKEQVEFDGTLQEFFTFMQTDEQFYYPDTDEGRQAYLDANIELIDSMKARLDELFITKPKAELVIKRVEEYRELSAGIAFYQGPAIDGSRPGTYYANLSNMENMPKYEMEALSYHEAIPGHHMQISIAQELEGLPKYRTQGTGYTSYSEGWGLYSEYIPKELGFYTDPYSDFGRLSMELWRACRLVVDAGIHSKQWTREEGIAFYVENTPAPEDDCIKMVERHIVMPSQATAYKIGQLKILGLRDKAKEAMGEEFDIREFHEVVLTNGPVPLNVLEELVDEMINQ